MYKYINLCFIRTDGNADGYFSLDSTSGNLTLEKQFDPATMITHNLTIQANDTVNTVTTNLIVNVITGKLLK
jgi:hypothetical protein